MKYLFTLQFVLSALICLSQGNAKPNSIYRNAKFDTIYVSHPSRNVKITVDEFDRPPVVDIGTKDFGAKILGCCDIVLKAAIENGQPTSLYFRYGDNIYNGTIAYRANLSTEDEVIDFRKRVEAEPINETRAITVNSPSFERQFVDRRIGILEGKVKDKYDGIATIGEKLVFKLADIMQDETYLYVKLGVYNESRETYSIEDIDFLYRNTDDAKEYKQVQDSEEVNNGVTQIPAKGVKGDKNFRNIVVAFPKFSVTSKWELKVTIKQKDGSRNVSLFVPYKVLSEATKIVK